MFHLEDTVEEIATGRPGHIDVINSERVLGQEQIPNAWRVHFSDGKTPLMQYFKSEDELRLVKCPHEDPQPGFVPESGIMG